MEKIKEQIKDIVKYEGSDLESLKNEYQELGLRINEGLSKMKTATVFTEAEIKEISDYARQLLISRFEDARQAVVNSLRDSFEF